MTLKKNSKKRIHLQLMRITNESFLHRRHRYKVKNKKGNNIERKKRLEEIKNKEDNQEIKILKK